MSAAKIDDTEALRRGLKIAEILSLRKNSEGRYQTTWGTKTALGLFRTMERLILEGE